MSAGTARPLADEQSICRSEGKNQRPGKSLISDNRLRVCPSVAQRARPEAAERICPSRSCRRRSLSDRCSDVSVLGDDDAHPQRSRALGLRTICPKQDSKASDSLLAKRRASATAIRGSIHQRPRESRSLGSAGVQRRRRQQGRLRTTRVPAVVEAGSPSSRS